MRRQFYQDDRRRRCEKLYDQHSRHRAPADLSNQIQVRRPFAARPQISHAIFDFDGTLSWLRHGWPEIMFRVFRPLYPAQLGESEDAIHDLFIDDILGLNGKPSIHQMTQFVERVRERGGTAPAATELLREYQSRLDHAI